MHDVVLLAGVSNDNNGYNVPEINSLLDFFRPVGPYRLRTFLAQYGFKTKVVDYITHYTVDQIDKLIDASVSDRTIILGLSTTWTDYTPDAFTRLNDIIHKYKSKYKKLKIVCGGPNPTTTVMDSIDYYITGYGERALLAILTDSVKRTSTVNDTPVLNGTFDYGFPNEYRTQWLPEDQLLSTDVVGLEVGRGCIFKCAFCSFPLNGKSKSDHVRCIDELRDELMYNYETFGMTRYTLTDDTFNDSIPKLEQIAEMVQTLPFDFRFSCYIKPELLAAAPEQIDLLVDMGLESTSLGIESLNEYTRKIVHKGYSYEKVGAALSEIKSKAIKRGIKHFTHSFNMIIGLPGESEQQVRDNRMKLLDSFECDAISYNPLIINNKANQQMYPLSPIDLDPEKYGYKVRTTPNPASMYWKSEHMNIKKAVQLTLELQEENLKHAKIAAFQGSNMWNVGLDVEQHFETTSGRWLDMSKDQISDCNNFIQKRVDDYYAVSVG